MNKKIFLSLLALVMVFSVTGCGNENKINNESSSKNKTYKCEYSVKSNDMQTIDEYIIEIDNSGKAVKYSQVTGYENATDSFYESFCDGIKKKEEKYDYYTLTASCDKSKNKAIATKVYDVLKIKDIEELSAINKFLNDFTNEDGTFNLNLFKDYFNTDSLKKGNYTCNF